MIALNPALAFKSEGATEIESWAALVALDLGREEKKKGAPTMKDSPNRTKHNTLAPRFK